MAPAGPTADLADIARVAARHRVLMIALVILATLAGVAAWQARDPRYTATSTVMVAPITTEHFGTLQPASVINMATEVRTATSNPVLSQAAEQQRATLGELADSVSVTSPKDSLLLLISATGTDPALARERSDAVAKAYLRQREHDARADIAAVSASIERQTAALEAGLRRGKVDQATAAALRTEVAELTVQRSILASAAAAPGRITSAAQLPAGPSSPGLGIFALGGFALGLLIAPAASLTVERFRRTIGSRSRLAELITDGWICGDGRTGVDEVLAAAAQQLTAEAFTLRSSAGAPRHAAQSGPTIVAVLDLRPAAGGQLAEILADRARAEGWQVTITTAATMTRPGRSQPPADEDSLTVVDLRDGPAHARTVLAARLATLVVVAVTSSTSHRALREFSAGVDRVAGALLLPDDRAVRRTSEATVAAPAGQRAT